MTTTSTVVAMLLLFFTSCTGDTKEVVVVEFDPENTYTMKSTDVLSLISDSGITRYSIKTKEWLSFDKAADPYWYFPEGIYVEEFDSLFQTKASIEADTAYYFEKKGLWKAIGNVKVLSLEGEDFQTDLLFWDQKQERVYSDKPIRIVKADGTVVTGVGFESNQDMTKYDIFQSTGVFPIKETPADSTKANSLPSATLQASPDSVTSK